MTLKDYRSELGISIKEASISTCVPLRTYIRYEKDETYGNSLKREQIYKLLKDKYEITEEKGILSINEISKLVSNVLKKYNEVEFCYLFGSYAKGYAKENSDIDLCISTSLTGLSFVGLIEELREKLNKKIDLLRLKDLNNNIDLINDIMKEGIKIYG